MSNPPTSVVIVNYNGKKYLDTCLSSLEQQTHSHFEVIFVDNASTDGSVEYVKEHFPPVHVIENSENYGFAKGNNIGIEAAKGKYVATLNNDTRADPAWIEELTKAMETDDTLGMCASKMLFMDRPDTINSTGINVSRSGACWDRGLEETDARYTKSDEVFGPCAGAALYRREMLDEVGLFDEDFFGYMEDVDLAFRGRLAGWGCIYVPTAKVYHVRGGTGGFESDLTIYYGNRNVIWNVVKNFPTGLLLTSLPWIIGRNLAVISYYAFKGHGRAALKSKVDAVFGIPRMLKKRKGIKRTADIKRFIKTWAEIP